jgi:uncharacterized protein
MAKEPVAGRVKTRLAAEIGLAQATRFARHAAAALLQRVAGDRRWHTTLAVAPDAGAASRFWPRGVACVAQGPGDLGHRMQRIFARLPPGPVVIVGTDIPDLGPRHIAEAFRRLGRHDAVFGPAADGGYWLVGLRRRPRVLRCFGQVRWSSPHALADTLGNLAGHSVARLETLRDIDTARDLARGGRTFGRRIPPPVPHSSLTVD